MEKCEPAGLGLKIEAFFEAEKGDLRPLQRSATRRQSTRRRRTARTSRTARGLPEFAPLRQRAILYSRDRLFSVKLRAGGALGSESTPAPDYPARLRFSSFPGKRPEPKATLAFLFFVLRRPVQMLRRIPSTEYRELLSLLQGRAGERIAEADPLEQSGGGRPIDERLVQAIWNEQLIARDRLVTLTGKPVRVVDPGRWSGSGPGPDFRAADLEIGGKRLRGDVEIHVDSAEWGRHRHSRDFEYNGVVLHAFLRLTDNAATDMLHNGEQAERLELEPVLSPDLDTIVRSLGADECHFDEGAAPAECRQAVSRLDPDLVRRFLIQASRERMEEKAARYAAQRSGESADQVLYQAVMAAMGHRGGKTLYFLLAKRTPLEELKDYLRDTPLPELPAALEATLLHVANLAVPRTKTPARTGDELSLGIEGDGDCGESPSDPGLDEETLRYLDTIYRQWTVLSGYFSDRIIPPSRRWFDGVRPQNFPGRRLAGVARLLANFDFRRGLLEGLAARVEEARRRTPKSARDFRREIAQLSLLFAAEGESYWSRHYTLGGKPAARRMQLIGDDRATSVLYNALLPNVLLHARARGDKALEEFVWRLHENFPALPENSVTKFMRGRLFGPAGPPATMDFRYEKFNQALLHVFHECCNDPIRNCEDCVFAGKALARPEA